MANASARRGSAVFHLGTRPAGPWLAATLAVFLGATVIAFVYAAQWYNSQGPSGVGSKWSDLLVQALADWWIWAAIAPAVLLLSAVAPLDSAGRPRNWGLHLAASGAAALTHIAALAASTWAMTPEGEPLLPLRTIFFHLLPQRTGPDLVIYWGLAGLAHAVLFRTRLAERDETARQLQAELTEAQLEALRSQLNPHFLFNALNTISGLVHREPGLADRAIADLGDILRNALQQRSQIIPLDQELQVVERYLALERLRLGDRLNVVIDVDDAAMESPVPVFALQLLAENAVRHGIEPARAGGTLAISGRRTPDGLELIVWDEAHAHDRTQKQPGHGVGLPNIRERLRHLFGESARLLIEQKPGGTQVRLIIPSAALGAA